jgi:acetyl-CoA carboxylase biotin carboxylase subunit
MITGIDLVKEQLRIAWGEKLRFTQEDIKLKGHAIECRVNAEDPDHDFRPCPGTIEELCVPGGLGVRIDSAIYCGYKIPHCYDSMIAKVIAFGDNRNEAIVKMRRALAEFAVGGVKTNINFQLSILDSKEFLEGEYDTSFLSEKMVKKDA